MSGVQTQTIKLLQQLETKKLDNICNGKPTLVI